MSLLEGFGPWLKSQIETKFDGNVSAFVRKCEELDKDAAPDVSTVSKKYFGGSTPGLDKALTMAYALGMTIDQFASMGKEEEPEIIRRAREEFNKRIKKPAPRTRRAGDVEPFPEELVNDNEGPPADAPEREIFAGFFHFGPRRINAFLCFRTEGEPANFGGYSQGS